MEKQHLDNLPEFLHRSLDLAAWKREMEEPSYVSDKPRIYQMETTSRCNLECPFCPRTTDLLENKLRDLNATMALDEFTAVLDQMPWLESLELFHFGEPFMQNDFHKYVEACKERGIYTIIASNLLPATEEKVDKVFAAGLDFLVMDIDSLDKATYERARVKGNIDILKRRVGYILDHPYRPYTVAQSIMLTPKREYEMPELMAWSGATVEPEEIRYKFLDTFRGEAEDAGKLGDHVCREAFYGFTVHVNGNVVVCDRDWAGENIMGNLFEETVEEIWNGKRFNDFRAQMLSPNKPQMCVNCEEGKLFNARSQGLIQVNMFKGNKEEL